MLDYAARVNESPFPKVGMVLAVAASLAMIAAGASPWLALAVLFVWTGSLWLSRPAPGFISSTDRVFTARHGTIAPFIEPLGVPLLLLDGERIVAANAAAREALGHHVAGQDARIALRHPDAIALLGAGAPSVTSVSGLTGAGSLWQLSCFEIDERHRLIEFVNRTAEADISRAHTDFVANASHELRTPLASILGYLETLRDAGTKVDVATSARFLGIMNGEARRMQALVEDLMSLSRIEAEKHAAPGENVDLAALAESVIRDIGEIKGTDRLNFTAPAGESPILGERTQLDQLIRNLVDNALKYGDADAPVSVTVDQVGRKAILRVTDTGPGISRDHLPHLTRRFYRTDPARSRASGGTGLGLAIVKHIVERHRGNLDIASKEGMGTTVTAQFPLADGLS